MLHRILLVVYVANVLAINGLCQNGSAAFTYISGPNFCLSEYGYAVPAFCTAPGEIPLGSFPIPPIGGFYLDPNFGAKVRLLTDGTSDSVHEYSTPSAFSATGKYIFAGKLDGSSRVIETATGRIVADTTGIAAPSSALWSPLDDDVLYSVGPNSGLTQIVKYQISTGRTTVLVDYATDGHHFSNINFGGTGDLSADNWAAFWAETEHQVCAVDLNQLKTYCADYTAPNPKNRVGWNFIDYVMITKGKDIDTNKRYVLLMATPAMGVYSVNEQTGALDFEYRGPEAPAGVMGGDRPGVGNKDGICDPGETCISSPHADVFQDSGRQYILVDVGLDTPCEDELSSLQISKGIQMLAPVESGGGRKFIFTLFKCGGTQVTWSDLHFGCAKSANAFCAISLDGGEANLPTVVRDGRTPFQDEVIVMRGNGTEVRRLAMHRSIRTSYWDSPRACISQDGGLVLWDSNFGNPANHRIVVAETGFASSTTPGCSYAVGSSSLNVGAAGGSGTISVTPSAPTCPSATASSNVSWATAAASGNTVTWTVTANSGSQSRIGSLNVAGQAVIITQSGIAAPVAMTLFPSSLVLGTTGTVTTAPQSVSLTFAGGSPSWTATSNQPNITVSPTSGVGNGTLQISVTPGSGGTITINAPGAANSPQVVPVQINSATETAPFGSFDTPLNYAKGLSAAVAVTGWALDSIGVTKVDIWRDPIGSEPPGLIYIGDAVFVAGARPDVAQAFPSYPFANRAGWGYLLLTNFLPNSNGARGPGNGTYTLHALVHNRSGAVVDLGARTILVDNLDATLPFGNIDTPAQGGTVWGNAYLNFGWALTPMPGAIATDGTTITVNVDGITLAHPSYNQFRGDIAIMFPGFANSNGAIGFAYIDTTKLSNGLHTISWSVWDNKIRGNGIGSRFFNVLNVGASSSAAPATPESASEEAAGQNSSTSSEPGSDDPGPPAIQAGPRRERQVSLEVEEMDRIELPVGATYGYVVANGERQPLPIGSTLQDGVFYWQLAPVFLGEYNMVFLGPQTPPTHVRIVVRPKTYSEGQARNDQ